MQRLEAERKDREKQLSRLQMISNFEKLDQSLTPQGEVPTFHQNFSSASISANPSRQPAVVRPQAHATYN